MGKPIGRSTGKDCAVEAQPQHTDRPALLHHAGMTAKLEDPPKKRQVALPVITASRCTGCGWCVAACPDHLLVLEVQAWKKSAQLALPALCTGCAKCIPACNFGAIEMVKRVARQPPDRR
jgi:ferredoxin